MAEQVQVRVDRDGQAEHGGTTYTFPRTLAGAVVTITVDGGDGPPAASASKAAWVDHAVAQGADRDEAEALTKDALVEAYGG